jgi:adenylyltransferase/sulfurtransferase
MVLIDDDEISLSNLARQILYCDDQIGKKKVEVARERLKNVNADCNITTICERISHHNAVQYLNDCDLIIDASDNFTTRYLLNQICIELKKPLLSGSVVHYTGQIILFHPTLDNESPCYTCLYPIRPQNHEVPTCLDSGVLSPVTGTIGSLMATEAIKHLTQLNDKPFYNEMIIYGAFDNRFDKIQIRKNPICKACQNSA